MAIFNAKSNKKESQAAKPANAAPAPSKEAAAVAPVASSARVLISARITEKASDLMGKRVYAFNVTPGANKRQVSEAIRALYKVTPVSVRMMPVPTKRVRHAKLGVIGTRSAAKKAYVELKDGDTISLM